MIKILLFGGNGQVGWELRRTLATLGNMQVLNHSQVDLSNPDSLTGAIREIQPNLIVNAAAYTAVDKAEDESDLAMAINGNALEIMAAEAKNLNAAIVHYSTDYVFDGTKTSAYTEQDKPNPINVYGKSKLAGERALEAADIPYIILRTSWAYGARGKNFMLTMLRLTQERDELKIVDDQVGAPTWSRMIAEATSQIVAQSLGSDTKHINNLGQYSGLYHLSSSGQTTWYGFTEAILKIAAKYTTGTFSKLRPILTSEYPTPAQRPTNSILLNDKLEKTFGLRLPLWEVSLELCMDEYFSKI